MNTAKFCFHLSRMLFVVPVALSLSGCVLGTKVGDLPGESTSAGETAEATDTDGVSSGKDSATSQGATGAPETTGDNTGTSGEPATTGAQPGMCEGLDEATCMATPACRQILASAFDFVGCPVGPQFLGCIPSAQNCDEAITTVCRDGTDEVYLNTDGCLPAGFSVCQTDKALCGSCEALDEAECLAEMDCQGLFGAPHVEAGGEVCVDFEQKVFLACAANGGACPPFVPTVCPVGDPGTQFDVPSGCIPFGFVMCEGGTPACM